MLEDGVEQKVWLCGGADEVIETLKAMETRYPALEHVWFHWPEGMPQAEYVEQLHRLAEEVMPAFRGREAAAARPSAAAIGGDGRRRQTESPCLGSRGAHAGCMWAIVLP
jgi:hypothetical protein